jgi:hypothetical protein
VTTAFYEAEANADEPRADPGQPRPTSAERQGGETQAIN